MSTPTLVPTSDVDSPWCKPAARRPFYTTTTWAPFLIKSSFLALLYIGLEDILHADGGSTMISELKLDLLVSSSLRPLQMCLKTIAVEFSRVMAQHEIM